MQKNLSVFFFRSEEVVKRTLPILFFRYSVRLGQNDLSTNEDSVNKKIKGVHIHPEYKSYQAYFDVAVVEIETVQLNENIRTICLPAETSLDVNSYNKWGVILTGWGSEYLHGLTTPKLTKTTLVVFDAR
jgi:hypothetical protein